MADQTTALETSAPGGRSARQWLSDALGGGAIGPALLIFLLVLLTVVPVMTVIVGSFRPLGLPLSPGWTFDNYIEVWSSSYTYKLVINTLIFSLGSTALALVVAIALSWLLERTDLPGRNWFRAAIIMPMVTPPLLLAMGWVLIMSPRIGIVPMALQPLIGPIGDWLNIYSMGGMIFIQGLAYVPTAVLIFSPVVRNMDPTYEEAAIVARATRFQTLMRVSLPFLLPAMLSTATFFLIVGMLAFDVPSIIGIAGRVDVMSTEIYQLMIPPAGPPNYGVSAAFNSSLFILLMLALVIYFRLTQSAERFATISGKGFKATRFSLGKWKPAAVTFVVLYFLCGVVLPFIALLWASVIPYFTGFDSSLFSKLSLSAYTAVTSNPRLWVATWNSVVIAAVASVGVALLSLAIARVVIRRRGRFGAVIDAMAMLPLGIPHLTLGIAMVFLFFSVRVIPLYGTIWIIAIGHLIAYLPVASRMMQSGMMQISNELEEAAHVSGASMLQNIRRIVLPLLKPATAALLVWMIVHSVREFSIAIMLQSGRNEVLSTFLYSYWATSAPERAAAVAVLLMLALFVLVAVANRLTRQHNEA